jgi:hypothetical protein
MGITIHYKGRLDNIEEYKTIRDEITEIASVMGWESTTLDDDWSTPPNATLSHNQNGAVIEGNLGLKGVQITPDKTETIEFLFDNKGTLQSLMSRLFPEPETEEPWIAVKTQFATIETHTWIIGLLKYIKKHYISNLQVQDEGEYWETGNINILKEKQTFINKKLNQISDALTSIPIEDSTNMSIDQVAEKIEEILLNITKKQNEE